MKAKAIPLLIEKVSGIKKAAINAGEYSLTSFQSISIKFLQKKVAMNIKAAPVA